MNTEELRRLAEQADPDGHDHESLFDVDCSVCLFIQAATPQAILSLLDELTSEQMERSDAEIQLQAAEQRSADASERVAALEERLRYMKAQIEEEIAGASDGSFFDSGALAAYSWVLSLFPVLQASAQAPQQAASVDASGGWTPTELGEYGKPPLEPRTNG